MREFGHCHFVFSPKYVHFLGLLSLDEENNLTNISSQIFKGTVSMLMRQNWLFVSYFAENNVPGLSRNQTQDLKIGDSEKRRALKNLV